MEQENELEALATFIKNECPVEYDTNIWPDFNYAEVTIHAEETAKNFISAGYRKVPKGSVVIPQEDYERLIARPEEVYNEMTGRMLAELEIEKRMGKVKAQKILQEVFEQIVTSDICLAGVVQSIAEKYGIEI